MHPETWSGPVPLATHLESKNCELVNRAGLGLSEAGQAFENLNQVFKDCNADMSVWSPLWEAHEMTWTCQTLNSVGYPSMERTQGHMEKAVKMFIKFSTDIRLKWDTFFHELAAWQAHSQLRTCH